MVSNGAAGYYSAAELVCLAQGLVFGCPRTAKENAALRDSMTEVSPEQNACVLAVAGRKGDGLCVGIV